MFNLKYEILKEDGKMYIGFPKGENVEHPEHKFMAIELTRYLLNGILNDNMDFQELSQETAIEIAKASHVLEQISGEVSKLIVEQNNALGELGLNIEDDNE